MKANEAPEKIYISTNSQDGTYYISNQYKRLIEYTRTDAIVKKVEEYLKEHLIDYWAQRVTDEREFIKDFRKYIKVE